MFAHQLVAKLFSQIRRRRFLMVRHCHRVLVAALSAFLLAPSLALGAVQALFDLSHPKGGPFPSDRFTVRDRSHLTGLRVSLPSPDCSERPSDCEDMDVINTLDGFNLQPRLSIPFDGPIDVDTVSSGTVFLIELRCRDDDDDDDDGEEECDDDGRRGVKVVGINQVVWDTFTSTLHVESDELLDQHTRYALIVTRGVRDESGSPIEATQAFRRFRQTVRGPYKQALLDAIHAARRLGVREEQIVVASVFTTQSVTAILEKIRDQTKAASPEPATFNLGPDGQRTIFPLGAVTKITFKRQTGDNPPAFSSIDLPLPELRIIPGAVSQLAFGKYVSPDYRVHPGEYIPPVGTRTGIPEVQGSNEIFFNLSLPSGAKPAEGWPVVIHAHGGRSNKNADGFFFPAIMAGHGLATLTINLVGSGFGPLGILTIERSAGEPVTFSAGGRGFDTDNDRMIGPTEGAEAVPPRQIIDWRDRQRQSAVDLMQLVRVIEAGMDADGDSVADIDPSRIYFFGHSLGANVGTLLVAVEPNIRAGAFTSFAGPLVENRRLGSNRNELGTPLSRRVPSLLNPPGITHLDGVAVPGPAFNENMPLRDGVPYRIRLADGTSGEIRAPLSNTVPGAMEIQQVIENLEWVFQSGNQVAYMPYLRKHPLPNVPARPVLFLFGKGDQTVPNPVATRMLRAGDLADRATLFRNDVAFGEDGTVPKNPHQFVRNVNHSNLLVREIAHGAQGQMAVFFASNGETTIHPEPARFFDVPIAGPLPENFSFIP